MKAISRKDKISMFYPSYFKITVWYTFKFMFWKDNVSAVCGGLNTVRYLILENSVTCQVPTKQ